MGLDNLDQNYFDPNFPGDNHPWNRDSNFNIAIKALQAIANPVEYLKNQLEEGETLNGMATIMILEKPDFYRNIAEEALSKIK